MGHKWKKEEGHHDGFELKHFAPHEFDHPQLMDADFMENLDTLRETCGFPLRINDDARTDADMKRIYRKEIAKGQDYPTSSAHLQIGDNLVRAVDIEPAVPVPGDGSSLTLEERELELIYQILRMYKLGFWPDLGLGLETGHIHIDDTPRLAHKRPAFWVAVSK
tara:strand:- start:3398 stop:3889 length:492 start_codon:yes stop_codon:yes gene_type:complete